MALQITNTQDLFDLAKILRHQTDFQEVLRLVAHKSAQLLEADLALILMVNPDTRQTIKTMIRDGKATDNEKYGAIHTNVSGWMIHYKKTFLSKDIHKDNRFTKGLFESVPFKSVIGVPIIVENIIIGTLLLLYKNSSKWVNAEAIDFLENIAAISAPFLRNVQRIREYFHSALPEASLLVKYNSVGLFGKSPEFIELLHAVEAAAKCDVRVLLDGKTGTGKELIAGAIHRFSSRADSPFIAIDCGAIPNTLVESELFGHIRGAFTGAQSDRRGLFLEVDGGTLFMDEINNLPFDMQAKLLRTLESGEVRPIGSNKTIQTDVRLITASSVPLKKMVEEKQFREDLFFRLHVYPIHIPDLRERQDDIILLANHFLLKYAKLQNKKVHGFHEEIIDFMKQHEWDGNIRELENFVERLVTIVSPDVTTIDPSIFPGDLQEELKNYRTVIKTLEKSMPIKEQMNQYEAELIKKALIEFNWNQSAASRFLGIPESTLRYKMKNFNIQK